MIKAIKVTMIIVSSSWRFSREDIGPQTSLSSTSKAARPHGLARLGSRRRTCPKLQRGVCCLLLGMSAGRDAEFEAASWGLPFPGDCRLAWASVRCPELSPPPPPPAVVLRVKRFRDEVPSRFAPSQMLPANRPCGLHSPLQVVKN